MHWNAQAVLQALIGWQDYGTSSHASDLPHGLPVVYEHQIFTEAYNTTIDKTDPISIVVRKNGE